MKKWGTRSPSVVDHVVLALVVIASLALITAAYVYAHGGGVSQKDGCHNDRQAGERHYHHPGTAQRAGICETRDGINYRVIESEPEIREVVKEVPVEVVKEVVRVQKTADVQAMEDSHKRIVSEYSRLADQLRELLDRPLPEPQVVRVDREVPGLKPTPEQCVQYRVEVEQNLGWTVSTAEQAALNAINAGCF